MFSTLRTRFGIPGVISVMALVFAMFGGAYAASNSSNGGKATASAKAKKGPRGPKGATGPAGPAGPAGPQGPKGDTGSAGSNGSNGSDGSDGQSVTAAAEPAFGECGEQEGVKLTSASGANYVCNGAPGEPWSAGGTLPEGSTETGVWAYAGPTGTEIEGVKTVQYNPFLGVFVPLSFTIPLAAPLDGTHSIYVASEGSDPNCPGTAAEPAANSGYLCVYETTRAALGTPSILAPAFGSVTGVSGALIKFIPDGTGTPFAFGTWAVTG